MYRVLYRKWRPQTFADVVGQEHITKTLCNELSTGRVSHAYLFTGPRGTGKTSCAKILAKAVNCLDPQNGDACGKCENCRKIETQEVLDINEIDAASNNGVDNIRTLREQVNFAPAELKYRVYIIDETHMLSDEAFNAMLKTLEEPPSHIIFILATTEVNEVPATILSRCQRFDFRRIDKDVIKDRLLKVSKTEGLDVEESAAELIAVLSDGGMRDALSTLDICASHSNKVTEKDVEQICAAAGRENCFSLTEAVLNDNTAVALETIDSLHKAAVDMRSLCREMISHLRNLMIVKSVTGSEKILSLSSKEFEKYQLQAEKIDLSRIMFALTTLSNALSNMNGQNARQEMEMAFIKLCNLELSSTPEALLARIEKLERSLKYAKSQPAVVPVPSVKQTDEEQKAAFEVKEEAEEVKPETKKEEVRNPFAPQRFEDGSEVFSAWEDVMSEIKVKAPFMAAVLKNSKAYLKGGRVLIDCDSPKFLDYMRSSEPIYRDGIKSAIKSVTGHDYSIGPYKAPTRPEKAIDPLDELASNLENLNVPTNE